MWIYVDSAERNVRRVCETAEGAVGGGERA